MLIGADLVPIEVGLISKMMVAPGHGGFASRIRMIRLGHAGPIPAERREAFVNTIIDGSLARSPPEPDATVEAPTIRLQAGDLYP